MTIFIGEFIGTFLMILLGGGVVANVVLDKTKGNNSGWIVITFGWAIAVFVGVYASTKLGGSGHLNAAVSIAMAYLGKIAMADLPYYILAQVTGAMTGAFFAWLAYKKHYDEPGNADAKLATFATGPAIRNTFYNLISEAIGTFALVMGALLMPAAEHTMGSLDALPVSLLVLGLGLSLGGATGYAINPARDLGPRIIHAILPIKDKRSSDWSYAWIPIVGPIVGALAAAMIASAITIV